MSTRLLSLATLTFSLLVAPNCYAQAFTDVPSGHYASEAIEYLKSKGIIQGYEDGTFKPDQKVNRAEAMKFIIAPLVEPTQLEPFKTSVFSDVNEGDWFLPFVEYGRTKNVIDGPPKKTAFKGADPIIKVEFLKMLLLGQGIDANSFNEIRLPLSSDVTNPDEWFYPYLRYSITSSMTMISKNGTLGPANQLTRGDTALLLYRLMMYKENRRTQALLSEAESEILVILGSLEKDDITQAEYASARALLAARGAHASKPDNAIVQGALKITESFRALVRAYRAGINNDLDNVIKLAGDAWHLADSAKERNPEISTLSDQVQLISTNMANSARGLKEGQ